MGFVLAGPCQHLIWMRKAEKDRISASLSRRSYMTPQFDIHSTITIPSAPSKTYTLTCSGLNDKKKLCRISLFITCSPASRHAQPSISQEDRSCMLFKMCHPTLHAT